MVAAGIFGEAPQVCVKGFCRVHVGEWGRVGFEREEEKGKAKRGGDPPPFIHERGYPPFVRPTPHGGQGIPRQILEGEGYAPCPSGGTPSISTGNKSPATELTVGDRKTRNKGYPLAALWVGGLPSYS
jgi:hypothetical protein